MPDGSLQGRRFVLIEDDAVMGESLMVRLSLEGAEVRWWTRGAEAARSLPGFGPEAVVCDLRLPDLGGEALFQQLARQTAAPFLFMTAYSDIDQAVRLMRAGAADYVTKPFDFADFRSRLDRLLLPRAGALGPSAAMRMIEAQLQRLATRPEIPVLLTGETGAGKQVCARFLHDADRSDAPFLAVDCAGLGSEGCEAALFGPGGMVSVAAAGGTLFLDSVAELPPDLQPRFLRLIEERRFLPAGSGVPQPFAGAHRLRHPCRSARAGAAGTVPRGPALSHRRRRPQCAPAARAAGGHPVADTVVPAPRGRPGAAGARRLHRGRTDGAASRLARQCPRAAQPGGPMCRCR